MISIIIPVYNGENTIDNTIRCLVNQTFKDIEIIVVNDGSTDNTLLVLQKWKSKIRIVNKRNGGVSSARNKGIKEARGEYLMFVDADDECKAEMIEKIYGKEFAEKIQNTDFLKNVQSSLKPYNNVLEFAEGMSRELLGIEQVKKLEKTLKENGENNEQNSEHLITPNTIEHDTQGIGLQEINNTVQEIKQTQKQKIEQKEKNSK